MKLSINYLRGIVKNCNSAISLTSDSSDVQRLTLRRETAYTAIKFLQSANRGERSIESVYSFCAQNGIELQKNSGKDESTWKSEEFGIHLKGRFGTATLERIADKQELGIEHGDIGVVRNLGNQYGRSVNPPKDKVKHVAPTIPSKYKDRVERSVEGKVVSTKVIGRPMPQTITVTASDVATIAARAEVFARAGRDKMAKKYRRIARSMERAQTAVRAERKAVQDQNFYGRRSLE